jgi:hypothetical protein
MTNPDPLDPLAFCGGFAYLDSDIPPEMTLADWRARRAGSPSFDSSTAAGAAAGPDHAPHGRTLGARMGAQGPRGRRGLSPGRKR